LDLPWVEEVRLKLVPEPDNPHDPDAIAVQFEYAQGKHFHLGYIPNADTICLDCAKRWDRMSEAEADRGSCMRDQLKHNLARHGTATRIKWALAFDNCCATVEEVTGGGDGQSLGCNIKIWQEE
jgi:hypothetical protein